MSDFEKMKAQMANGAGFIAALDQSGGSTPKALRLYGVEEDEYDGDDAMFAEIHKMRSRIITAEAFTADKVIGAILFERTMNGEIDGVSVPKLLWEDRGVVPFLKIDLGLEAEENGAQVMKPMPGLAERLAHAKSLGIFGTKERSVIHSADAAGIKAVVAQQFEVARVVTDAGLVPIIEPEVNINSDTKAEAEDILAAEIMTHLDALPEGAEVMLKLTIPTRPGLYDAAADHPRVVRVVALSGGYSTDEACTRLAQNAKMIASFSRALAEGLSKKQTDEQFAAALAGNIDKIYAASVA
jgi:fructose-bisphosphate aldolase class I